MKQKQEIHFIINPFSGYNKKEDLVKLINDNLDKEKFNFKCYKTEARGHATELSRASIANGADVVLFSAPMKR